MDAVPDSPPAAPEAQTARTLDAFLAGLQAGMAGALWMLAWLGLASAWERRGFWASENLMAGIFHPNRDIAVDFGWSSISGLAVYLLLYSLLGACFAMPAARAGMKRTRVTLLALGFAVAWYYFAFHLLWRTVSPPIAFLQPERPTVVGHLIYGLLLGRFFAHLPPRETQVSVMPAAVRESRAAVADQPENRSI